MGNGPGNLPLVERRVVRLVVLDARTASARRLGGAMCPTPIEGSTACNTNSSLRFICMK
jgi:hypothetical protein